VKALGILLFTVAMSSLLPRQGNAAVYNSNGTAAGVQTIHNTLAQDGDTITLPAGTFTWNSQIRITKNITLAGAGQGVTVIYDNIPKSGGDPTVPMHFTGITGNLRATGFTLRGQAQDTQDFNKGTLVVGGTSHSVRIDHVSIELPGTVGMRFSGDIWGVVDHCNFNVSNFKQAIQIFHSNYGGGTYGDVSWESPTDLGSGKGIYIEDCTFTGSGTAGAGVTDSTEGGRFVFRHNTVTSDMAATHGTESQRYRGVRSYEIYNNTFTNPNSIMFCAVYLRGGTGVIWGNAFRGGGGQTGYRSAILTDNYRSWNTWQSWGRCNGTAPWDQNSQVNGYAALDQVGRGMALDQIRGQTAINQRTGNAAWPRNQLEPVYVWGNVWAPVPNNPGVYIGNNQSVVQTGRDIINNGNSSMPGYTPYVYPHPLVSGSSRATVSDFNADSHPDYVLQNATTRETAIWYLNNNLFLSGAVGPTLVAGWTLTGLADFNRDGYSDYGLFASSTHQTALWYLSGPTYITGIYGPTVSAGWELVTTGDFNGDNKPDYVLYNASTHQTAVWYLNNNVRVGTAYGPTLPAGWNLIGVGDFNGDGHPDYVVIDSNTGQTAIGYLSGLRLIGGASGPTIPSGWLFVATADFNGDGKPDYVLYNVSTRQTAIWYLNNNIFVGGVSGPTLPAGWSLVGQ
jgi:hypothetical protein